MVDYLTNHLSSVIGIIGLLSGLISHIAGFLLIEIAIYIFVIGYIHAKYPRHKIVLDFIFGLIGIIVFVVAFTHYHKTRGCVHILNKQYAHQEEFGPLIRAFEKESGIDVTIESPNPEKYPEIYNERYSGKGDFPTLFMIGGHHDLDKYGRDCLDLTGTDVAKELTSDDFALKGSNGRTYGLAFIVESFGIAVNTTLLQEAGYSISDIRSFSDLEHIAKDITVRKEKLGFAAFTTGTVGQESGYYRLAHHAPTVPLFYEMQDCGLDFEKHLKGTYMDAFQDYVDLCLDNATTSRQEAPNHSSTDARQEFIEGKAVFHQDGLLVI